jgi:hypothetical protein
VARNIIASPELFAERVVGHPLKYESHRLGSEKSEDALSWNVFRSLQEVERLAQVAKLVVGSDHLDEPNLYLWGLRVDDNSFEPWELLLAARNRFEANLPEGRPPTEPDIILHLPGKYLLVIEAKFTSPNTVSGPTKQSRVISLYNDTALQLIDTVSARKAPKFFDQLWRNVVFAEWMALRDGADTKPYLVNLVRMVDQEESKSFKACLCNDFVDQFNIISWEQIFAMCTSDDPADFRLRNYMRNKSTNLKQAFRI